MSSSGIEPAEADTRLQDPTILEEIDLYSDLMIIAAASTERVPTETIDEVLKVRREPSRDLPEKSI